MSVADNEVIYPSARIIIRVDVSDDKLHWTPMILRVYPGLVQFRGVTKHNKLQVVLAQEPSYWTSARNFMNNSVFGPIEANALTVKENIFEFDLGCRFFSDPIYFRLTETRHVTPEVILRMFNSKRTRAVPT